MSGLWPFRRRATEDDEHDALVDGSGDDLEAQPASAPPPPAAARGSGTARAARRAARAARRAARSWARDFSNFIAKGDFFDLAAGVVMGTAVTKVVTSLVDDVLGPALSVWVLRGGSSGQLGDAHIVLRGPDPKLCAADPAGPQVCDHLPTPELAHRYGAVTLNYGRTLLLLLDFIAVSLALFLMVRAYATAKTRLRALVSKEPPAPPPPDMRVCPFCLNDVHRLAARCMYCTSTLALTP
ncbi:hypothetical protein HK405_010113 [Cladochytrium tenue]|nr:hypothetical protein HK405_010113 [Cladochytrium tenue]